MSCPEIEARHASAFGWVCRCLHFHQLLALSLASVPIFRTTNNQIVHFPGLFSFKYHQRSARSCGVDVSDGIILLAEGTLRSSETLKMLMRPAEACESSAWRHESAIGMRGKLETA